MKPIKVKYEECFFDEVRKACDSGSNIKELNELLNTDAGVAALTEVDENGRTPLHFALTCQNTIPYAAEIILNSKGGKQAAITLVNSRKLELTRCIFLLSLAMRSSYEDVVDLIVKVYPDILKQEAVTISALAIGYKKIVDSSLKANPGLLTNPNFFLRAVVLGDPELVERMLKDPEIKKQLNVIDDHGYTPLHAAAFFNHKGVIKAILNTPEGMEVWNRDSYGVLNVASKNGSFNLFVAAFSLKDRLSIYAHTISSNKCLCACALAALIAIAGFAFNLVNPWLVTKFDFKNLSACIS